MKALPYYHFSPSYSTQSQESARVSHRAKSDALTAVCRGSQTVPPPSLHNHTTYTTAKLRP